MLIDRSTEQGPPLFLSRRSIRTLPPPSLLPVSLVFIPTPVQHSTNRHFEMMTLQSVAVTRTTLPNSSPRQYVKFEFRRVILSRVCPHTTPPSCVSRPENELSSISIAPPRTITIDPFPPIFILSLISDKTFTTPFE
ncbi:hypothetical protein BLNAU_3406 [Blattamonas nauphoetae]|uniref:Uncharacterized protein n=1 Tax=Blattamonas nauphoetae TaxID=2049346 RepID=A0ABQ9YCW7_9EUKA|nr:hypothetical protein BLNAU_3406 [Blattamonas nauphoetae]